MNFPIKELLCIEINESCDLVKYSALEKLFKNYFTKNIQETSEIRLLV